MPGAGAAAWSLGRNNLSGGVAWTPSSLVVENAGSNEVLITWPSKKTILISDFTIVGITATVLGVSWDPGVGNVCTLILSVPVVYGDVFSVVYKGKSYPVTNNVVAWTPLSVPTKIIGWYKESEESGGQQPNKMDGGATHLTVVSGSGLNKVYTLPAGWVAYDTDNAWWKTDASLSTTDGNRLIAYDFARTIVKYDNTSPYVLREIIILSRALSTDEMNHLRDYAQLSIWWSGVVSGYGNLKGNKPIAQQYVWTPETITVPTISTKTIEQASPSNIVITFDNTLNTSYIPATTDYAVLVNLVARGVITVAVAGAVNTLTLASACTLGDVITVTYTKSVTNYLRDNTTGGAVATFSGQSITNNIIYPLILEHQTGGVNDTSAWYDFRDLTTITKDGSNHVTRINNKLLVSESDLSIYKGNSRVWSADGVTFNGLVDGSLITDDHLRSAAFELNQPVFYYFVVKPLRWTLYDTFFDGYANNQGQIQENAVTPNIRARAGSASTTTGITLNAWNIIRVLFNGANSKLIVNEGVPVTGDFGAANPGGIIVGASMYLGNAICPSNILVAEMIVRKVADSVSDEGMIYNYLKTKYSV